MIGVLSNHSNWLVNPDDFSESPASGVNPPRIYRAQHVYDPVADPFGEP